jgi:hypothetical protein
VLDRSSAAQVVAFAGRPQYQAPGRNSGLGPNGRWDAFLALGYRCGSGAGGAFTRKVEGVDCATVYYLDRKTGRLAGFWTASSRFHTAAGSAGGSAFSKVRREPGASPVGAPPGFEVSSGVGSLFFGSRQSAYQPPPPSARVAYIEIFAAGDPIGLASI